MNYVLFHENCMDGFAAAYVAWKEFGDQATYIPVNYGQPFPYLDAPSNIYILDFSYPRDILLHVYNNLDHDAKMIVLDHHKTAQEELEGLTFARFDMNKCGAVMAWEYFNPQSPVPRIFQYIQDRDLWKWELPNSKEVNAYLQLNVDFSSFEDFENIEHSFISEMIRDGKTILKYQDQLIRRILKTKHLFEYDGVELWSVNSPVLQSELGNELAKEHGMGDVYYFIGTKIRHSLRSVGDIDVSVIAKKLGGGGHKNAAGFESRNE